ncbi:hypothetical protein BJ878DRAFT_516481 [Calycina marina]|uniref:Uncharacterized protein n=1 Tax=Calycina marina TaxID=1763456 RepID=A0A9P8CCS3_9HELO|nr:hypothetical protein BJ878DRAFT_516481 [Calycina marina]
MLVPYNTAISIGAGYNSYTQQLCINDAVEQDIKRGKSSTNLSLFDVSRPSSQSQKIEWITKFVDTVTEVADSMNVSGAVLVKENGTLDSSTGAFVNLDSMKDSDLNYLVQVKVTSKHLEADHLNQIREIEGISPADVTEVYGDTFVSGFIEGGEFTALLSVKVDGEHDLPAVKQALETLFNNLENGEPDSGQYDMQKLLLDATTTTRISVAWIGDTTQDPSDIEWSVQEVREAAEDFPSKVGLCPQRIHAVLTPYAKLSSYIQMTNSKNIVDYGSVKAYTDKLLDDYFEYKNIWKQIETGK